MGKIFGTIVQKKLAVFCERTGVFSKGQNRFRIKGHVINTFSHLLKLVNWLSVTRVMVHMYFS